MTTNLLSVIEQQHKALEALHYDIGTINQQHGIAEAALAAGQQALEQTQKGAVGGMVISGGQIEDFEAWPGVTLPDGEYTLYTHPQATEPQAQGEASEVAETLAQFGKDGTKDWPEWMKAAAHTATASFPKRSKEKREFDIRGVLAAKLTCWHRMTEADSDALVALFTAHPQATEPAQEPGIVADLKRTVQALQREEDGGWTPDAHSHLLRLATSIHMLTEKASLPGACCKQGVCAQSKATEPAPSKEKDRRPTLTVSYSSKDEDTREYCSYCGGDGEYLPGGDWITGGKVEPCPFCDGSGRVNEPAPSTEGEHVFAEDWVVREDILQMARATGAEEVIDNWLFYMTGSHLERFAALASAAAMPVGELTEAINAYGRACRRDGSPAWESEEGQSLRAILAAARTQPVREPMTDGEILDAYCKTPGIHQFVQAFKAGARCAEAAHGIK